MEPEVGPARPGGLRPRAVWGPAAEGSRAQGGGRGRCARRTTQGLACIPHSVQNDTQLPGHSHCPLFCPCRSKGCLSE